jgi:phage terminase small subunit
MKAPAWLSAAQAAEWSAAAVELGGDWTPERLRDLEQYACRRAVWLEAEVDLAANGAVLILRNDKGEVKSAIASPYCRVGEDARKAMAILWGRLCAGRAMECAPSAEQVRAIVAAFKRALPAPDVAEAAGVSVGQLRAWIDAGEDGDPVCAQLVDALEGVRDGAGE